MRRPSCTWLLSLGLALAASGFAPDARADAENGYAFEWRAPEGCPPASAVELEIEHLLGGLVREHARADLQVQATVQRGSMWMVTLETASKTASGHRTIEAASCQGLANATALIVALMIDPDAVALRTSTAKGEASQPPSRSVPTHAQTEPGAGGFLAIKANAWLLFPIHADVFFPLWRPHYVFSNVPTPIFQSWFVGGRLTAGVELRF